MEQYVKQCADFANELADEVIDASLEQIPRKTGALANSTFKDSKTTDTSVQVTFGYGGGNEQVNPETGVSTAEYAVEVHEDLQAMHPNGKAKFLEDPSNEAKATFESRLTGRLR